MRIAEVAEFYSPNGGGVRSYIDQKFEAAARAGHELFVLAPAERTSFEKRAGGGVVWVESPALPFDRNYRMFWDAAPIHALLDRLRPDLVEASSPWRGAWIVATWAGRSPRAMFVHSDPVASYPHRWLAPFTSYGRIDRLFEWYWAYFRRLAARFDALVVGGAWLARRFQAQDVGRFQAVALGIDRSAFSPDRRDPGLRSRLLQTCGLPESSKLLLGVGRHHAEKRWPLVISAAVAAGGNIPIGLVLVGDGMDRARVMRAAGGNPHVQLVAPIRDRKLLAAMLASADALIHGCDCETFGLVAGEALASGLPIITPDRGGCAEMAESAVAETYRSGDGRSAAAAIRRMFARDPDTLRAASLSCAARVRSDAEHFAELFGYYGRVVDGGRAHPVAGTRSPYRAIRRREVYAASARSSSRITDGAATS